MSRGGAYERLPMYALSESTSVPRLRSPIASRSPRWSRDRSSRPSSPTSPSRHSRTYQMRPRTLFTLLKFVLPASLAVLLLGFFLYEPHFELTFYSREWIRTEIKPVLPLSGCFDPARVSPLYNLSDALYGARANEVQAGMTLRLGLDCYDFAGTIQSPPSSSSPSPSASRTRFHTYWRTDLAAFGARQEYMLHSFFATQPPERSHLTLWSNGDLSPNPILARYAVMYPASFSLRVADVHELAKGTTLDGSPVLGVKDGRAWVDGDLVRLLVVWAEGGVWVDMDSLLTRDLAPLLDHEFVTQWDCYDKIYQALNGALLHFRQHSPYLCEAFHIMASSAPPRSDSTDWGALLYLKLWRALVAGSIPPFKILPFCFSDGRSCRLDNRLPDPFVADGKGRGGWVRGGGVRGMDVGAGLDNVLTKVFAVHLHNQWEKVFPSGGWVERLLLRKYEAKLAQRTVDAEEL